MKKSEKGITLIALVITIIVLLILAGISISMLSEDNGILQRATDAKIETERTEIEEQLKLASMDLSIKSYLGTDEQNLENVISEVKKQDKYRDKLISETPSGRAIIGVKLDETSITIENGSIVTVTGKIEREDNSNPEAKNWYALVNGNKYKITYNDGDIKVSKTAETRDESLTGESEIPTVQANIGKNANNENFATVTSATVDSTDKETVTIVISATKDGVGDINIGVNNGILQKEGTITSLTLSETATGIYISTLNYTDNTLTDDTKILTVDGSMLLSAGSLGTPSRVNNKKYLWSSSDPNVVEVTSDGVVKCKNIGTVTITLKGKNNSVAKCRIRSTAKVAKTNSNNTNWTINGATATHLNPTIPAGFYPIDTNLTETIENNIDWKLSGDQTNTGKGLVIMNNVGDQFVWIPVKKDEVIYNESTSTKTPPSTATTVTSDTYTPMATTYDYPDSTVSGTLYRGMQYDFTEDKSDASNIKVKVAYNSQYNVGTLDYREPSLITDNDQDKWAPMPSVTGTGSDAQYYTSLGYTTEQGVTAFGRQMQLDFNEMITQVQLYGGFWVGRYESSWNDALEKVSSIAGAKSYTAAKSDAYSWYGLYKTHKEYSATSSMIWGSQYDAMMNWMAKNNITVATSTPYGDAVKNTGNSATNGARITGNPKYNDKIANIIDLYGNSNEFTLAATYNWRSCLQGGNIQYRQCNIFSKWN